jgi:hypothetical protein
MLLPPAAVVLPPVAIAGELGVREETEGVPAVTTEDTEKVLIGRPDTVRMIAIVESNVTSGVTVVASVCVTDVALCELAPRSVEGLDGSVIAD